MHTFDFTPFLPKLTKVNNFKKPKLNSFIEKSIENQTYYRLILILVATLALTILTIYNAKTNNYKGAVLIANYLFAAGALVVFFINLYILILKRKRETK